VNDQELAARARQLAGDGIRSAEAQALARELLRQLADLAERAGGGNSPAPVIGYLIDGKVWHPSDVTIVRQDCDGDLPGEED
jgi:hypothetical protein